jgi:hypothetical protein
MNGRGGTFAALLMVAVALLPARSAAQTSADGLIAFTFEWHCDTWDFELAYYTTGELVETPGLDVGPSSGCAPAWQASLSRDGRYLAFRAEANMGDVRLYDRVNQKTEVLTFNTVGFNESAPSLSGTGRYVAYSTNQSGAGNVKLFDRQTRLNVPLPGLNTTTFAETQPSINGGGRFIAFTSNRNGDLDVFLYDRDLGRLVPLPGLNRSGLNDYAPSISGDGSLIAFTALKKAGGASYIRLYNRITQTFAKLPGIHDYVPSDMCWPNPLKDCWWDDMPSINAAGTLIAFSSGRCYADEGFDHPCLYLYDRGLRSLSELRLGPFGKSNFEPAIR